jgi:protein-tyrosine phosphatase
MIGQKIGMNMARVLFVCLGNICRSPAAEGVFESLVKAEGLEGSIEIDSAGTSSSHVGEKADRRMRNHAIRRGYELTSLSRQFVAADFEKFDFIVVMDDSNYSNVVRLDHSDVYSNKVYKMVDFCEQMSPKEVPDPYYGGEQGFETVLDIVEDASRGLLKVVKKDL